MTNSPDLYQNHSYIAKANAQRNLCGRTHYVDDDTLRYHKSRVVLARVHDEGLLFSIVTSDAVDENNTRREFRFVIFDLFGFVIARPDLGEGFRTSQGASTACYGVLNKLDAVALTHEAIERETLSFERQMTRLLDKVGKIAASSVRAS